MIELLPKRQAKRMLTVTIP